MQDNPDPSGPSVPRYAGPAPSRQQQTLVFLKFAVRCAEMARSAPTAPPQPQPSGAAPPMAAANGPAPGDAAPVLTAQIRAARGLLRWTQATLAHRAGVSAVTLNMIENETVRPRDATLAAIRRALEGGGVQFLEEDGIGVGVRFAAGWRSLAG